MDTKEMFQNMPDIGIITDAYGYILDYNMSASVLNMKKGRRLIRYIPDCFSKDTAQVSFGGRVYRKSVSAIMDREAVNGYTVSLVDVTEITSLIEEREEKRKELLGLVDELIKRNVELEKLAFQAKELTDYSEQLAIARKIHDDEGHAITAIHTICEMCLKLKDSDIEEYEKLLQEGIDICKNALSGSNEVKYQSLNEMFDGFVRLSQFPVEVSVEGVEPEFIKDIYEHVGRICKEAYHNTLSHSLADRLSIRVKMEYDSFTLKIQDNGSFRGRFEKGFGLTSMEDYVKASGGTLEFITREGEGFGIIATWRKQVSEATE